MASKMYARVGEPVPSRSIMTSESTSVISRRSFHRLAFLVGLGGAAYLLYNYYKAILWTNISSSVVKDDSVKSVRISKIVEVNDGGIRSNHNMDSKSGSSITTNSQRSKVQIVLHQTPRGYLTPCISPFALKLETFLRVANVGYEVDFFSASSGANTPWMTINGEKFTESQDCISELVEVLHIDLNVNAAQESRKIASRLVGVMLENHIYWGISLWRWVHDEGRSLPLIQPLNSVGLSAIPEISEAVARAAWYHGLGRLTQKQVAEQILKDLGDLSAALGKHAYFLGESPGEVDCGAFSMLGQMIWSMPQSPYEAAVKQYRNLVDFVLRMRDNYWPDWEAQLQTPGHEIFGDTSGLIPGIEFLTLKQLHSESTHSSLWDSKTTSTITLTDFVTEKRRESRQSLQIIITSHVDIESVDEIQSNNNSHDQLLKSEMSIEGSLSRSSIDGELSSANFTNNPSPPTEMEANGNEPELVIQTSALVITSEQMPKAQQEIIKNDEGQSMPALSPLETFGMLSKSQQQFGYEQIELTRNALGISPLQMQVNQFSSSTIQDILRHNHSNFLQNPQNSIYSYPVQNNSNNFYPPSQQQSFGAGVFNPTLSQSEFSTRQQSAAQLYPSYSPYPYPLPDFGQQYHNTPPQYLSPSFEQLQLLQFLGQHQQFLNQKPQENVPIQAQTKY